MSVVYKSPPECPIAHQSRPQIDSNGISSRLLQPMTQSQATPVFLAKVRRLEAERATALALAEQSRAACQMLENEVVVLQVLPSYSTIEN